MEETMQLKAINPGESVETLRAALGGISPLAATKVKPQLDDYLGAFIRHSPFAVMASSSADGDCDASPRGGKPGFVKIIDDRTLLMPDIGGNRLFQSQENFVTNPKVGLLFMIPGMNITARVNGRVRRIDAETVRQIVNEPELEWSDANSKLVQGILIDIDETYFHCPRSFQFADLWNTRTQQANAALSLKDLLST